MKKTFLLFIVLTYLMPTFALAQTPPAKPTEYELLAPLPLNGAGGGDVKKTDASSYIKGFFTLMIGIAGVLAVIMIVLGGIKYMSTDAFGEKNEAKAMIEHAIWGLLLAMSAWLILSTVNPGLTNFNLNIPVQEIPPNTNTPGEGGGVVVPGPSKGMPWESDASVRAGLPRDVIVNKANCSTIGQENCTSLTGMSSGVLGGISTLARNCNCAMTITGGTEYWLHGNGSTEIASNPTDHKPGGSAADFSMYGGAGGLSNYLKARGTKKTTPGCSERGSEKYTLNGATFVNEGDHWHTCF